MKKLFGVTLGVSLATVVWFGCSSTNVVTSGQDGGSSGGEGGTETGAGEGGSDGSSTEDANLPCSAPTGAYVDITYGGCPPFTPCGGDPKGTWNVKSGCVDESVFAAAKAQCAGLTPTNVKFTARGSITASAVVVCRSTEVKFTADFLVPASCKNLVGSCSGIETVLKSLGQLDTATCTDDVGGCECQVGDTITDVNANAYTVSGNTLAIASPPQTYDFCVNGANVQYRETSGGNPRPYVITLSK